MKTLTLVVLGLLLFGIQNQAEAFMAWQGNTIPTGQTLTDTVAVSGPSDPQVDSDWQPTRSHKSKHALFGWLGFGGSSPSLLGDASGFAGLDGGLDNTHSSRSYFLGLGIPLLGVAIAIPFIGGGGGGSDPLGIGFLAGLMGGVSGDDDGSDGGGSEGTSEEGGTQNTGPQSLAFVTQELPTITNPEPASILLMASGLFGLFGIRKKS